MSIDPSAYVAPTARVDPKAEIGSGCHIGEYCVVEAEVKLGRECVLDPHVYVRRWTTLGDRNRISAGCVLGSDPLDKAFTGERSFLSIGSNNIVREHFTISRGTKPESVTRVGDGNFIMTSGHIAHDCQIANRTVIASCALIAGYADIGEEAFISGGVVVHQYSRVGRLAMVGGNTRVNVDLPPFLLFSDFNAAAVGLNVVGLRRANISKADIAELKRAYSFLYRSKLSQVAALEKIDAECPSPLARELTTFIRGSKRGISRERRAQRAEP